MYIRAASDETLSAGIDERVTQLRSGERRQLTLVRDRASHFELPIWIQQYDFKDGSVEGQEERDLRVLLSRFNAEQYSMASFQRWATQTPSPIDRTGKSAEFYDALFFYAEAVRTRDAQLSVEDGKRAIRWFPMNARHPGIER